MTPTEADALAKRIINCWHGGPNIADWRDALEPLDAGRAGTAYARLRNERDHAPSIKAFRDTYNALDTHDGSIRKCAECVDSGWVDVVSRFEHNGLAYTGAEPCKRCPTGKTAASSNLWQQAPRRQFITDAEAERLIAATRARHPSNSKAGA